AGGWGRRGATARARLGGGRGSRSGAGCGHRRFPLAIVTSRFRVGSARVRLFLCSTAHRFSVPTWASPGAPRAAAVKTGRRPPPLAAAVLTAASTAPSCGRSGRGRSCGRPQGLLLVLEEGLHVQ